MEGPPGEEPGQQPDRRAGVAAVEDGLRFGEPREAGPPHDHDGIGPLAGDDGLGLRTRPAAHLDPEGLDGGPAADDVVAVGQPPQSAGA